MCLLVKSYDKAGFTGEFTYFKDKDGFRNDFTQECHSSDGPIIYFIGDSYTFGSGVSDKNLITYN